MEKIKLNQLQKYYQKINYHNIEEIIDEFYKDYFNYTFKNILKKNKKNQQGGSLPLEQDRLYKFDVLINNFFYSALIDLHPPLPPDIPLPHDICVRFFKDNIINNCMNEHEEHAKYILMDKDMAHDMGNLNRFSSTFRGAGNEATTLVKYFKQNPDIWKKINLYPVSKKFLVDADKVRERIKEYTPDDNDPIYPISKCGPMEGIARDASNLQYSKNGYLLGPIETTVATLQEPYPTFRYREYNGKVCYIPISIDFTSVLQYQKQVFREKANILHGAKSEDPTANQLTINRHSHQDFLTKNDMTNRDSQLPDSMISDKAFIIIDACRHSSNMMMSPKTWSNFIDSGPSGGSGVKGPKLGIFAFDPFGKLFNLYDKSNPNLTNIPIKLVPPDIDTNTDTNILNIINNKTEHAADIMIDSINSFFNAKYQQLLLFTWFGKIGTVYVLQGEVLQPINSTNFYEAWPNSLESIQCSTDDIFNKFGVTTCIVNTYADKAPQTYYINKDLCFTDPASKHKYTHYHYKALYIAINLLRIGEMQYIIEKNNERYNNYNLIPKSDKMYEKPYNLNFNDLFKKTNDISHFICLTIKADIAENYANKITKKVLKDYNSYFINPFLNKEAKNITEQIKKGKYIISKLPMSQSVSCNTFMGPNCFFGGQARNEDANAKKNPKDMSMLNQLLKFFEDVIKDIAKFPPYQPLPSPSSIPSDKSHQIDKSMILCYIGLLFKYTTGDTSFILENLYYRFKKILKPYKTATRTVDIMLSLRSKVYGVDILGEASTEMLRQDEVKLKLGNRNLTDIREKWYDPNGVFYQDTIRETHNIVWNWQNSVTIPDSYLHINGDIYDDYFNLFYLKEMETDPKQESIKNLLIEANLTLNEEEKIILYFLHFIKRYINHLIDILNKKTNYSYKTDDFIKFTATTVNANGIPLHEFDLALDQSHYKNIYSEFYKIYSEFYELYKNNQGKGTQEQLYEYLENKLIEFLGISVPVPEDFQWKMLIIYYNIYINSTKELSEISNNEINIYDKINISIDIKNSIQEIFNEYEILLDHSKGNLKNYDNFLTNYHPLVVDDFTVSPHNPNVPTFRNAEINLNLDTYIKILKEKCVIAWESMVDPFAAQFYFANEWAKTFRSRQFFDKFEKNVNPHLKKHMVNYNLYLDPTNEFIIGAQRPAPPPFTEDKVGHLHWGKSDIINPPQDFINKIVLSFEKYLKKLLILKEKIGFERVFKENEDTFPLHKEALKYRLTKNKSEFIKHLKEIQGVSKEENHIKKLYGNFYCQYLTKVGATKEEINTILNDSSDYKIDDCIFNNEKPSAIPTPKDKWFNKEKITFGSTKWFKEAINFVIKEWIKIHFLYLIIANAGRVKMPDKDMQTEQNKILKEYKEKAKKIDLKVNPKFQKIINNLDEGFPGGGKEAIPTFTDLKASYTALNLAKANSIESVLDILNLKLNEYTLFFSSPFPPVSLGLDPSSNDTSFFYPFALFANEEDVWQIFLKATRLPDDISGENLDLDYNLQITSYNPFFLKFFSNLLRMVMENINNNNNFSTDLIFNSQTAYLHHLRNFSKKKFTKENNYELDNKKLIDYNIAPFDLDLLDKEKNTNFLNPPQYIILFQKIHDVINNLEFIKDSSYDYQKSFLNAPNYSLASNLNSCAELIRKILPPSYSGGGEMDLDPAAHSMEKKNLFYQVVKSPMEELLVFYEYETPTLDPSPPSDTDIQINRMQSTDTPALDSPVYTLPKTVAFNNIKNRNNALTIFIDRMRYYNEIEINKNANIFIDIHNINNYLEFKIIMTNILETIYNNIEFYMKKRPTGVEVLQHVNTILIGLDLFSKKNEKENYNNLFKYYYQNYFVLNYDLDSINTQTLSINGQTAEEGENLKILQLKNFVKDLFGSCQNVFDFIENNDIKLDSRPGHLDSPLDHKKDIMFEMGYFLYNIIKSWDTNHNNDIEPFELLQQKIHPYFNWKILLYSLFNNEYSISINTIISYLLEIMYKNVYIPMNIIFNFIVRRITKLYIILHDRDHSISNDQIEYINLKIILYLKQTIFIDSLDHSDKLKEEIRRKEEIKFNKKIEEEVTELEKNIPKDVYIKILRIINLLTKYIYDFISSYIGNFFSFSENNKKRKTTDTPPSAENRTKRERREEEEGRKEGRGKRGRQEGGNGDISMKIFHLNQEFKHNDFDAKEKAEYNVLYSVIVNKGQITAEKKYELYITEVTKAFKFLYLQRDFIIAQENLSSQLADIKKHFQMFENLLKAQLQEPQEKIFSSIPKEISKYFTRLEQELVTQRMKSLLEKQQQLQAQVQKVTQWMKPLLLQQQELEAQLQQSQEQQYAEYILQQQQQLQAQLQQLQAELKQLQPQLQQLQAQLQLEILNPIETVFKKYADKEQKRIQVEQHKLLNMILENIKKELEERQQQQQQLDLLQTLDGNYHDLYNIAKESTLKILSNLQEEILEIVKDLYDSSLFINDILLLLLDENQNKNYREEITKQIRKSSKKILDSGLEDDIVNEQIMIE